MLESVDLTRRISEDEYKVRKEELVKKLVRLQQEFLRENLPVVICVDGWSAAGKGTAISKLVKDLDPRSCRVYPTRGHEFEQERHHFLERYWKCIGQYGTITIFDRSWYGEALKRSTSETLMRYMRPAAIMERQLVNDGYLVVKCFMHVSKDKQRKRLEKLAKDDKTSWRVSPEDFSQNKEYEKSWRMFDRLLEATDNPEARWHLIAAENSKVCRIEFMEALMVEMETALRRHRARKEAPVESLEGLPLAKSRYPLVHMPKVEDIRTDLTCDAEGYSTQLKVEQRKLESLQLEMHMRRIPMMLVYEGWDAAGKGGNIKRVAAALDARGYRIVPSASPTKPEKEHPFLWRYWINLPKSGNTCIYDRSWYGRVMVERVEGFCTESEWRRAFEEINEFEWQLVQEGALMLKFWINVSQDEQLRRFEARRDDPDKAWKLTGEDWRNRDKYPQYCEAINDMFRMTSTEFAPWIIVESDDKKYARLKTLRTINEAIEKRLEAE